MFYAFEEWTEEDYKRKPKGTSLQGLWDASINAMGAGMLILCLLDFVRLSVGTEFVMKG